MGYVLIYGGCLAVLLTAPGFDASEVAAVLLLLGVAPALAAWLATIGATPRAQPVHEPARELSWIALLLVAIGVGFLGYGLSAVRAAVTNEPARSVAILTAKLAVMVWVPALVFRRLGYSWRQLFEFPGLDWIELRTLLVMMGLFSIIQLRFGRGPQAIGTLMAEYELSAWQVIAMALPVWAWLAVEAGLVEEFLFRALLQSRMAAWLRSPVAGVLGMSVLFALAHAPGYVLRGAHTVEGMARPPEVLSAAAYAMVMLSPIGVAFGILWARTRNLTLVVVLHGWGDLIPNLAPLIRAFAS
ncbi:CPBP family intramembrane glutamic endopeptidase [Anaeromyxobacter sp. SG66]|uniref:CPBP family intramembrane glutamic endopeptidase n=1 Tax=Anaeromyxobacter sp. SG66 TaxID=2925410 RepID=UPI001F5AE21C|nr:CPBP family intramembrane glutamic endopeptidase [Anaeromyxobacter sp. SG66]